MSEFEELINAEFEHNNDGEEFFNNVYYGVFDEDGFPKAFYCSGLHGGEIPDEAVFISVDQWNEFISNAGLRRLVDGEVVEYVPPPPPPPVTVVSAVSLWSRLSDEEADAVGEAMQSQPFRVRKIFESAQTFREDHELWPLLVQIAVSLFGEDRAGEILAPSN